MARALAGNTTLLKLDVSCNGIGAEGAAAIARAVMANPCMCNLSLCMNSIGDQGATDVAMALKSLHGLQVPSALCELQSSVAAPPSRAGTLLR